MTSSHRKDLNWISFTNNVFDNLQEGDKTGTSVDIVPDYDVNNTVIAIGRPNYDNGNGAVSIYEYNVTSSGWDLKGDHIISTSNGEAFGSSVCMNKDSDCIAIGAPGYNNNRGAVYAYVWDGSSWQNPAGVLSVSGGQPGDRFGTVVSGSRSAKEALISAPYETYGGLQNTGTVRKYRYRNNDTWQLEDTFGGLQEHEHFGFSLQGSSNDKRFIVGSPNATSNGLTQNGRYYHYHNSGGGIHIDFIENGTVDFARMGSAVSITNDGNHYAITTSDPPNNTNEVHIYEKTGDHDYTQFGMTLTGEQSDGFGFSHQITEDHDFHIVIGAPFFNNDTIANVGYVKSYYFDEVVENDWVQVGQTIVGLEENHKFGTSISANATGEVIGAGAPVNSYAQFYYLGDPVILPTVPCFAPSTLISTEFGMKPISHLKKGDNVWTKSKQLEEIESIHTFKSSVTPLTIGQHAFGFNQPSRPITISPDHKLYVPKNRKTRQTKWGWMRAAECPYVQTTERTSNYYTYYHFSLSSRSPIVVAGVIVETLQNEMKSFNGK